MTRPLYIRAGGPPSVFDSGDGINSECHLALHHLHFYARGWLTRGVISY